MPGTGQSDARPRFRLAQPCGLSQPRRGHGGCVGESEQFVVQTCRGPWAARTFRADFDDLPAVLQCLALLHLHAAVVCAIAAAAGWQT